MNYLYTKGSKRPLLPFQKGKTTNRLITIITLLFCCIVNHGFAQTVNHNGGTHHVNGNADFDVLVLNVDHSNNDTGIRLPSRLSNNHVSNWQMWNERGSGLLKFSYFANAAANHLTVNSTPGMMIDFLGNVINFRTFISGRATNDYGWTNGKMQAADTRGFYQNGNNIWSFFGKWNNGGNLENVIGYGNLSDNAPLIFYQMRHLKDTDAAERMRLTASGMLAIGTDGSHNLASDKLAVNGVSTYHGETFQYANAWFRDNVRIGTLGSRAEVMQGAEKLIVAGTSRFKEDALLEKIVRVRGESYLERDVNIGTKLIIGHPSLATPYSLGSSDGLFVDGIGRFLDEVRMHDKLMVGTDNPPGVYKNAEKLYVDGPGRFSGDVKMHNKLIVGTNAIPDNNYKFHLDGDGYMTGDLYTKQLFVGIGPGLNRSVFGGYVEFHGIVESNVYKGTGGSADLVGQFTAKSKFIASSGLDVGSSSASANIRVHGVAQVADLYVDPTKTWSDFVFANDYQLRSLDEVSSFIKKNGHLPDVPSAAEVAEKGYAQTEVNATLLQKIEEITLYMIEMKEDLKKVTEENQSLKEELKELKKAASTGK